MNTTTVIAIATAALGVLAATLVARSFRGAHDVARTLAARGTRIPQIAKRTRLPQDVIAMVIAGSATAVAMPRQKVPSTAHTTQTKVALRAIVAQTITRKAS